MRLIDADSVKDFFFLETSGTEETIRDLAEKHNLTYLNNVNEDVIYFNNMNSQGIKLCGDNRTGVGEGDDERIRIDLESIPAHVQKIVFVVTIHEAQAKRQTFGMVENSRECD